MTKVALVFKCSLLLMTCCFLGMLLSMVCFASLLFISWLGIGSQSSFLFLLLIGLSDLILVYIPFLNLTMVVPTMETSVQDKADAAIPVTTLSPPEGNTTFLDGTTWCVALAGVSQIDLQNALDWACGLGMSDCGAIQEGGKCYEPDTLLSHASYAFNNYYQQNGNSDIACNFGGTATLTKNNPSYGKCLYAAPGSDRSATPPLSKYKSSFLWWEIVGILLLLYKGS